MPENPTVVFTEPKKAVIENRPVPKPGSGEVLVKSRRTLISTGTELTIFRGEYTKESAWAGYGIFPFVPGYDNVGDVADVGPGVDKSLVGKRFGSYAPHALYGVVPVAQLRTVPEKVTDDQAAFFTIAQITLNAVRRADAQFGESAVVYGLGLLGQFIVRELLFSGIRPVFAVDIVDRRLALLPSHPGVIPVNPKTENVKQVVTQRTKGRMADVVYEVTGSHALIPGEFEALKTQGRFIVVSSPAAKSEYDFNEVNVHSFTIIGVHVSSHPEYETPWNQWTRARNAEFFFDMVAAGEFDVDSLISHKEPYAKAPELYQMLLKDRSQAMGVILKWNGSKPR